MSGPPLHWLNYHHLLYFWATARSGSFTAASRELQLSPQTVSAQVRALELVVGETLLERAGRAVALTETGRLVFRYADEIFALGRELTEVLRAQPARRPLTLRVGMVDGLPKLLAHHVLEPARDLERPVRIVVSVGPTPRLLAQLAVHELDVVLSDAPASAAVRVRAFNHLLGESGVRIVAAPPLARRLRGGFPGSLHGAPMLLPAEGTVLRASLERWFDALEVRPEVVGELADSAVLKVFGQAGAGAFAVHAVVEREVCRQYRVARVGEVPGVTERFHAISVERRVRHPAVAAICARAPALFG